MTTDERLHWLVGFLRGLVWRLLSDESATRKIRELDVWAWNREWAQNLISDSPNERMSKHQLGEARAWGRGARFSRGLNPPFPSPPY